MGSLWCRDTDGVKPAGGKSWSLPGKTSRDVVKVKAGGEVLHAGEIEHRHRIETEKIAVLFMAIDINLYTKHSGNNSIVHFFNLSSSKKEMAQ